MNKRILKISNQQFYYTENNFVTLSQTNFPEKDISFKTEGPYKEVYWEVEIFHYDKPSKCLSVKVSDYESDDIAQFNKQNAKETVDKIIFKDLEWSKLEPFLSSYIRGSLSHLIMDVSRMEYHRSITIENDTVENIDTTPDEFTELPVPRTHKYNAEFDFPIKDIIFADGYVSIHKKFAFHRSIIEIKIYNTNIRTEYNHIKAYLHKPFKKKKISIVAEIEIQLGKVINLKAGSPEIDAIDGDLIDTIKQDRIKLATKIHYQPEIKKAVLTADELLLETDPLKKAGNIFGQSEEDIIKSVLDIPGIRNRRQIEYLAGYNQTEKIVFTPNPYFGFLFSIKGIKNDHFCWELLDSNATYLWSFNKNNLPEKQLKWIEAEIAVIEENGRNNYKKSARNSETNDSIQFIFLNHTKIESNAEDSFKNWKSELLKLFS